MREIRRLHPSRVAPRRRASAWAVIASLIALFLSQPFHATARFDAPAGSASSTAWVASPAASPGGAHDADLCSMCRATAQTRLGLRAAQRAGAIAPDGASLPLHVAALAPAKAAPQLREAQPRAPPASLPLLPA
ncbi:MAG TPA: hypothetical protein VII72_18740 [Myxococcota bacterium]|jgi:hypothetical protein